MCAQQSDFAGEIFCARIGATNMVKAAHKSVAASKRKTARITAPNLPRSPQLAIAAKLIQSLVIFRAQPRIT